MLLSSWILGTKSYGTLENLSEFRNACEALPFEMKTWRTRLLCIKLRSQCGRSRESLLSKTIVLRHLRGSRGIVNANAQSYHIRLSQATKSRVQCTLAGEHDSF
jgi:hypothetical protein